MLIRDEFCEVRVTYINVFIKKNGRLKAGVDFNSALGSIHVCSSSLIVQQFNTHRFSINNHTVHMPCNRDSRLGMAGILSIKANE